MKLKPQHQSESLEAFQTRAFARQLLFDLPFPMLGSVLLVSLMAGLMHGQVPGAAIAGWVSMAAMAVLARWWFVQRMRTRFEHGESHALALRGLALLSLPLGAVSGLFAWMYFDAQQPVTMVILGTYMSVVVVGAMVPASAYLPGFYLLVLPAHLPYLLKLLGTGQAQHLVAAGINGLFLVVVSSYAHAFNKLQREGIRLRHENLSLIGNLELRTEEAESASQTKGRFLAGVSHDLKQPLRAIGLLTGFLRHRAAVGDTPPHAVALTAGKIDAAVSAIHHQITRLLELSRLESGTLAVRLHLLDLEALFDRVRNALADDARARGVRLHFAGCRQRQAWADGPMLESIVNNLVSNAIKHAAGGRVYVGTRVQVDAAGARRLSVEVRDNGSGIAPQLQGLLFDAYRSFDDRAASESHGLGLAIAKAQATYLGCDVSVRSAPGCGSTFVLHGLRMDDPAGPMSPDQELMASVEPTRTKLH